MGLFITILSIIAAVTGDKMVLKKLIYESDSNFSSVIKKSSFTDKTLFIKTLLESPDKILIVGPRWCGKSTNIDMLKRFFEIEVNEEGLLMSNSTSRKWSVNDTLNYNLFTTNQLNINNYSWIMSKHFGKYPVIHADFRCAHKITNSENAVVCFRQVIHKCFSEHRYLCKSEILNSKEKRLVTNWNDSGGKLEKFYGQDVTNSLYKLAIILYKHFGNRKVFVLIDNYDYPSTSSLFEVKHGKELNRVIRFNMGIISKLLTGHFKYVKQTVIVGSSYYTAFGIHELQQVEVCKHLEGHKFQNYFGLTLKEVEILFSKPEFNLDVDSLRIAQTNYGGYFSKNGMELYSLHSVLMFLETGQFKTYFLKSRLVKNLNWFFKIPDIKNSIEKLVTGGEVKILINEVITINDLISVREVILKTVSENFFNTNILFYFLLEQGYLSYAHQEMDATGNSTIATIKIPNEETRTGLAMKVKEYYDGIHKLETSLIRKCASFFGNISPKEELSKPQLKVALYWFYKHFQQLLIVTKSRFPKFTAEDAKHFLFSIAYEVNINSKTEFTIKLNESEGCLNVFLAREPLGFFVSIRPNCTSTYVLSQILERTQNITFDPNVWYLGVRKFIYLGLSVGYDLNPTTSCLYDSKSIYDSVNIPDL